MKKTLIVSLAALVIFGAGNSSTNNGPDCIILQGSQTFVRDNTGYQYTGVEVYCADGCAIPLPRYNDDGTRTAGVSQASVIRDYLARGYRIQHIEGLNVWLTR